jgi:hypothetical protein
VTAQITAPWSLQQQVALKAHQRNNLTHPYTCKDGHMLDPSVAGWVCSQPGCDYVQNWAHDPLPAEGSANA